jgi:hypothetical protein
MHACSKVMHTCFLSHALMQAFVLSLRKHGAGSPQTCQCTSRTSWKPSPRLCGCRCALPPFWSRSPLLPQVLTPCTPLVMHPAAQSGIRNPEVEALLADAGIQVVADRCLMVEHRQAAGMMGGKL